MEQEVEKAKVWMNMSLMILVLFGVMMFKSCEEIKFKMSGQQIDANFQGIQQYKGRRGSRYREVKYSFLSPEGERVAGSSRVASEWRPSGTNNTVEVTYLKSDPSVSEVTETRKSWPIFVMLGLLVFGLFTAWKFNSNVNAEMSSGKKRR